MFQEEYLDTLAPSPIVGASSSRQSGMRACVTSNGEQFDEIVDGRFHVVGLLADGGMGRVVRAVDLETGRDVALKYVRREVADGTAEARLELEAKVLDRLRHPNVVEFIGKGQLASGGPFYVMELVRGTDLVDIVHAGAMSVPRALGVLRQMAAVIDHAHGNGVVHRDLKPENVIIVDRGGADLVKVLDFGIARSLAPADPKLTQKGMVLGTPTYMSPEQALGIEVAPASDRYSLAVMAFEMLTGVLPRAERRSPILMVEAIVRTPPRPPSSVGLDVPGLDAIFGRALAAKPEHRFTDAASFVDALENCLSSLLFAEPEPLSQPSFTSSQRDSLDLIFGEAIEIALPCSQSDAARFVAEDSESVPPGNHEPRKAPIEDPREPPQDAPPEADLPPPLEAPPESDLPPVREPGPPAEKIEDPARRSGHRIVRPRGEFPVVPRSPTPRRRIAAALAVCAALVLGAAGAGLLQSDALTETGLRAFRVATAQFAAP